jgi:hypothetical protein
LAGYSVPAHGLYLTNITYPDFKLKWKKTHLFLISICLRDF